MCPSPYRGTTEENNNLVLPKGTIEPRGKTDNNFFFGAFCWSPGKAPYGFPSFVPWGTVGYYTKGLSSLGGQTTKLPPGSRVTKGATDKKAPLVDRQKTRRSLFAPYLDS